MQAKKSLGQNFLKHKGTLEAISACAMPDMLVLEVGPGKGALTRALLDVGLRVVAVEKDESLVEHLREAFASEIRTGELVLVSGDALHMDVPLLVGYEPYQIIANLPYYITGHFMRTVLESDALPEQMVLLLQHEVVERILAREGKHSLLSLSIQAFGVVKRITKVPARYFTPAPAVDSAVVQISDITTDYFDTAGVDPEQFFSLVRQAFANKRKTLINNMKAHPDYSRHDWIAILQSLDIDVRIRAEDISLDQWAHIMHAIHLNRDRG